MSQCQSTLRDLRCCLEDGHEGKHKPMPWCPVPGCACARKPFQIMCRTHWFRVPKDLRDTIWRTVKTDFARYWDARNEAIAAAHLWVPKRKSKPEPGSHPATQ